MKILLSAYACQPNSGSEEGNGWNWSINLARMNHEVWVLTHSKCQEAIEKVIVAQKISNLHFVYVDRSQGLIEKFMERTRFNWQFRYFSWQRQALDIARELDCKINFDIVHHVTWGSITAGSRLWRLNKPFVLGPVGGGQTAPVALKKYFLDAWRNEALRSLVFSKLARFNWFSRQSVTHADLVLATNKDTYQLALRLGASDIKLFFDGALPEDYIPSELPNRSPGKKLKLLWVGSLIPRKGLRLSLEALSKVNSAIPLEITIVGSGIQSQYLSKWAKEFSIEKIIDYRGRLPWLEVKKLYRESDVFFFTSLRDSCPHQLLEAMSQGLPIITLALHGSKELVSDRAGIKVPVTEAAQTVEALAEAVEYLYYHPQERLAMGKAGYEFAKQHTWFNKAAEMTRYYEELLAREKLSK